MAAPSPSYINRLPNEILIIIFLFVFCEDALDEDGQYRPRPDSNAYVQSILVLRWVSRRFRLLVDGLEIWRRDDVNLVDRFAPHGKHDPVKDARILNTLLRDNRLASALSQKQVWRFYDLAAFFTTLSNIPEMDQNLREIELDGFSPGLNIAIRRLQRFDSLTCLNIRVDNESTEPEMVDLDIIATSCPHLQFLSIQDICECSGSLEKAANLRYVDLHFDKEHSVGITSRLIPSKSAQSLTKLTIQQLSSNIDDLDDFDQTLFHWPFENLTALSIYYLTLEYHDVLRHGKFALTSLHFSLDFEAHTFESARNLFGLSSVKTLRDLYLRFDCGRIRLIDFDSATDKQEPIIYAITRLRHLENLHLQSAFPLTWCHHFAHSRNLKSLHISLFIDPKLDGIQPLAS